MINIFKYLTQSIIVIIFFFIGKLIGLKNSRIIFSKLFLFVGPRFKSKKIINDNLRNFKKISPYGRKRKLFLICGKIME